MTPLGHGRYIPVRTLDTTGPVPLWLAFDANLGEWRALRWLRGDDRHDSSHNASFEAEAAALTAIRHANVVTLHDKGRDAHGAWLVLDAPVGGDIGARLEQIGPLTPRQVTEVAWAAANALSAVHAAGFAHLDVRPSHLFIDFQGVVRLGGFSFSVKGGPQSNDLDALGLTLYALASGHIAPNRAGMRLSTLPATLVELIRATDAPPGQVVLPDRIRDLAEAQLGELDEDPFDTPTMAEALKLPTIRVPGSTGTPAPAPVRTPIHIGRTEAPPTGTPGGQLRRPATAEPNRYATPAPTERGQTPLGDRNAIATLKAHTRDAFPVTIEAPMPDRLFDDDGVGSRAQLEEAAVPLPIAPTPRPVPADTGSPVDLTRNVFIGLFAFLLLAGGVAIGFGHNTVNSARMDAMGYRARWFQEMASELTLIDEIRELGGGSESLSTAWTAFESAPEAEKTAAAGAYVDQLNAVWAATPKGSRSAGLDQRVRGVSKARKEFERSVAVWDLSTQHGLGALAFTLGVAPGPAAAPP